jgi:hypothetical protein
MEAKHIDRFSDLLVNSLGATVTRYHVATSDGRSVRLDSGAECVKYLQQLSHGTRMLTLTVGGESGPSQAIKIIVNRLLLGAVIAGELAIQFGTVSYSIAAASSNELYAWRAKTDEAIGHIRQRGVPGRLATISMFPTYWIVAAILVYLLAFILGGLAQFELIQRNAATVWIRDHSNLYAVLCLAVTAVLIGLPWLLRWLYPYAVLKIGWEAEESAKLEDRRKSFLWGVVVALLVGIAGGIAVEVIWK